jgi:hypothetical protein
MAFNDIILARPWMLCSGFQPYIDDLNIARIIQETYDLYGERVTERQFNKMISQITSGKNKKYDSPISCRKDPNIIKYICILYPQFLTCDIVGKLIECMRISAYDIDCIEAISNTGYKFTQSQTMILSQNGYDLSTIIDNMTYDDFLALFTNPMFISKLAEKIQSKKSKTGFAEAKEILSTICKKHNLILDERLILVWIIAIINHSVINKSFQPDLTYLYHMHVIIKEIGGKFTNDTMVYIIKYWNSTYMYQNAGDYDTLKSIISFYDNFEIDRDIILQFITETPDIRRFEILMHPAITRYNPLQDIYYIISNPMILDITNYLLHLLKNNYMIYDDFLLFIISLRSNDEGISIVLQKYIEAQKEIKPEYIQNFFTFGNYNVIRELFHNKIMPELKNVARCTNTKQIKYINDNSIFLDDDASEYIEHVLQYDCDTYGNSINDTIPVKAYIKIYESLSNRDKKIFDRITMYEICTASTIVRYQITLTEEYVEHLIASDNWKCILTLIHLSSAYDYIIDMIDIDKILLAPNSITRIWLMKNIYESSRKTFATNDMFFDKQPNIDKDVQELLKKPIINDIHEIKDNVYKAREEKNKKITLEYCNSLKSKKI